MTIVFINNSRKWGGVKTWTLDFGVALRERGHRIVAVVRPGTVFEDACRRQGFVVHPLRFGPKYNPLAIWTLVRLLSRERASVAVVNISKDLNVGAVAAKLAGVPVVHRIGLLEDFKNTWEERLWHRWLVTRGVVPSDYLRRQVLAALPWFRAENLATIPNSKRVHDLPVAVGSGRAGTVFGVTSQLSPSKGHTYLLQACQGLREQGVEFHLRIAGEGTLEVSLREEVLQRGLAERVEFCGFVGDVTAFLVGLDAYVLPSLNESFSNAVLEAMAVGLPVVAFHAGGVPEVLGDCGVLTPPRDVAALRCAMAELVGEPEYRRRLGNAARKRAGERFDVGVNAVRLETLLGEVAGL